MNNKILGSKFEKDFAQKLSDLGYWVTLLNPNNFTGSQPRRCYSCER